MFLDKLFKALDVLKISLEIFFAIFIILGLISGFVNGHFMFMDYHKFFAIIFALGLEIDTILEIINSIRLME